MGRRPRLDVPGSWHHVMNRGAGHREVFHCDEDCVLFLDFVGDAVERSGIEVHGYALIPNHYHLLVRSPDGNLSQAMQVLQSRFTVKANRRHDNDGPVFRGRFRSQRVLEERHLDTLLPYLHLNPVRAGLVPLPDSDNAWTSHRAYLGLEGTPPWLSTEAMLKRLGGKEKLADHVLGHHQNRIRWPEEFDKKTGLFRAIRRRGAPDAVRVDAEALLDKVTQVTGASLPTLRTARRGRGANPARRFATWALLEYTDLRHAQIGKLLKMSTFQVAKSAERLRQRGLVPPLSEWAETLEAKIAS